MAPIRKLNDGLEGLRNERYENLRKVKRRDYQDSGTGQRQFQELVEEFNTEENRGEAGREKAKDSDRADIAGKNEPADKTEEEGPDKLESLNRKASHRVRNSNSDDGPVGGKVDINA